MSRVITFLSRFGVAPGHADPQRFLIWLNPKEKDGGAGGSRTPGLRFRNMGFVRPVIWNQSFTAITLGIIWVIWADLRHLVYNLCTTTFLRTPNAQPSDSLVIWATIGAESTMYSQLDFHMSLAL